MPFAVAASTRTAAGPSVRPVSASTAVRERLSRPAPASVLAAFPSAVYVTVGDDVLAVVASDGLRLPGALVVPAVTAALPFAAHVAGQAGEVAGGALRLGPVHYRPARWWSPREVLPPGLPPDVQPRVVTALSRALAATAAVHSPDVEAALSGGGDRLRAALAAGDLAGACAAADALVGLGPGLTPSGDDLLAGALVTCAQLRAAPGADRVAATAAELGHRTGLDARRRTTALSAALLRDATRGRAAEPVLGLVDALAGRRPLAPALTALLAVGHTSGADTARGVLVGARALLDAATPSSTRPGLPLEPAAPSATCQELR